MLKLAYLLGISLINSKFLYLLVHSQFLKRQTRNSCLFVEIQACTFLETLHTFFETYIIALFENSIYIFLDTIMSIFNHY